MTLAWSYDPDQIMTSPKDKVRFLVGDVVAAEPLVQDEEIQFALAEHRNIYEAAAAVCDSIAALYSRKVDHTTGEVSTSHSQRAKAYADRAKELRQQAKSKSMAGAAPLAGGITVLGKEAAAKDTNRVKPFFTRNWPDV